MPSPSRLVFVAILGVAVAALVGLALVARERAEQDAAEYPRARPRVVRDTYPRTPPPPTSQPGEPGRPFPTPALTPGQVVSLVMDALKNNDEHDGGIAVTFDFASPANREMTGPLERFIPMVKNPVYAPMLNHRSATVGTVVVRDDEAQALVTLVDANGETAAYLFRLSRQPAEGDLPGCWLTDGVIRVNPNEQPDEPNLKDVEDGDKPDRA